LAIINHHCISLESVGYSYQVDFPTVNYYYSLDCSGSPVQSEDLATECDTLMSFSSTSSPNSFYYGYYYYYYGSNRRRSLMLSSPVSKHTDLGPLEEKVGEEAETNGYYYYYYRNSGSTDLYGLWSLYTSTDGQVDPTIKPSFRPSAFPSRKPNQFPSSTPTVKPTAYPTSIPTSKPTSKPTALPTSKPTSISGSSSQPTQLIPTFLPTIKPSKLPSIIPTTIKPTLTPTKTVTSLPTTATASTQMPTLLPTVTASPTTSSGSTLVQVTFAQVVSGMTKSSWQSCGSACIKIFKSSVISAVPGLTTDRVGILNVNDVSNAQKLKLRLVLKIESIAAATTYLNISYIVTAVPDSIGETSNEAAASLLINSISNAVTSGSFGQTVRRNAVANQVPQMINVETTSVTITQVDLNPTSSSTEGDGSSDGTNDRVNVSREIVGALIGVLIVVIFMAIIFTILHLRYNRFRQGSERYSELSLGMDSSHSLGSLSPSVNQKMNTTDSEVEIELSQHHQKRKQNNIPTNPTYTTLHRIQEEEEESDRL
jgi:hypothetical protein